MKRLASTTIECGSTEITITGEVLSGTRATRDEPGSGAEINEIRSAVRAEPCSPLRRAVSGCPIDTKHAHRFEVDLDALERVLGPAAWSEVENALIEAAMDQDDGPDPDDERDQMEDR